jgi:hypothetical protein
MNKPFKPYQVGYETTILEHSKWAETIRTYYPMNKVVIIAEHVHDNKPYHYVVRPVGTTDQLKVLHWDLDFDRELIESRTFTMVKDVLPGVVIKNIRDGSLHMIREECVTAAGLRFDPNEMVEVMVHPSMLILVESMIR